MQGTSKFFTGLSPFLMGVSVLVTMAFAPQQQPQPSVTVHNDDITIRGCVGRAAGGTLSNEPTLVWSRGDIMLMNALFSSDGNSSRLADRVFYWIDNDKDLAKHVGQMVELKGDLGDFKKGEVKFDRDGDYTTIKMKLGGKEEKVRMPTAWLNAPKGEDDVDIVTRKIDVDKVKVLGACPAR
jgi:hypothetical protein